MRSDCKDSPNCDTFYLEEVIIVLGLENEAFCIAVRFMNIEFVKFTFFKAIVSKLSKEGLIDYS